MTRHVSPFIAISLLSALACGCTFTGAVQTSGNPSASAAPTTSNDQDGGKSVTQVRAIPDSVVMDQGSQQSLISSVVYTDGTYDDNVAWSSSDNTILTVDPTTGKASGVKAGVATAIATSVIDSSKKAMITVTVKAADSEAALTSITPASSTIAVGGTVRLNAQIQMSDGSISPNVVWTSDNQNVAIVSGGLVTGVGAGTTTITATAASNSSKKASATITVKAAQ